MMTYNRKTQTQKGKIATIALPFLLTFILLSSIYLVLLNQNIAQEKVRYGYIAANEAEHIVTTIDCIMARTNTLKALVQDHHGNTDFFNSIAASVYDFVGLETGVVLKNIAIAPHGVVSDVYPYKGNENLIGFDFMDLNKTGNAEAKDAYIKGDTVLTNPFKLIQGGIGMAGRTPVMLMVADEPELWGLVTITIDFEKLIEALKLKHLDSMGIDYELSYIDDKGEAHIMESVGTLGDDAVKNRFAIRNLTWELSLRPKDGWSSAGQYIAAGFLILLMSCFVAKFVDVFFQLRESNKTLKYISDHDVMTELGSRRAFEAVIDSFPKELPKNYCMLMADINGLKTINDTYGHKAGDELILGASECLRRAFNGIDTIYRLGGDEFCVITTEPPETLQRRITFLEQLTAEWKGNYTSSLAISYGMANSSDHQDIAAWIKDADQKMYECKRNYYMTSGKDRQKR